MKTKSLGICPFCGSINTAVQDDIQFQNQAFFIRRCYRCSERFVEYNRIVDMPWITMEEFNEIDEQIWTEHTHRRMEGSNNGFHEE